MNEREIEGRIRDAVGCVTGEPLGSSIRYTGNKPVFAKLVCSDSRLIPWIPCFGDTMEEAATKLLEEVAKTLESFAEVRKAAGTELIREANKANGEAANASIGATIARGKTPPGAQ